MARNRKVGFNASKEQIHIVANRMNTERKTLKRKRLSSSFFFFHFFLYYLFYISLDSYCLRRSSVWRRKKNQPTRFTTQNIVECCFFCCFVLNKCHKVIPRIVITWSSFFSSLVFFHTLSSSFSTSCSLVSYFDFLSSAHSFFEWKDSLKLVRWVCEWMWFLSPVLAVYLKIVLVSWVPNINSVIHTRHMGYVR